MSPAHLAVALSPAFVPAASPRHERPRGGGGARFRGDDAIRATLTTAEQCPATVEASPVRNRPSRRLTQQQRRRNASAPDGLVGPGCPGCFRGEAESEP